MIRIFLFGLVAVGLTILGIFFADNPGKVTVDWLGVHFESSVGMLLLLDLALIVACVVLFLVLRGLIRLPGAIQRMSDRRHSRLGQKALTQALIELEAGDARQGLKLARKVDTHLHDNSLTSLLTAKAAEVDGKEDAARREYEQMLKDPKSEFFGLRGLLSLALKAGDKPEALRLARRAHKLRPRTPWVIVTLFDLAIGEGDWEMALNALKDAQKAEALPVADIAQRRAVLLTAQAKASIARNEAYEATRLLRQAIEFKPNFIAAWIEQARAQLLLKKPRKARELIEAVWKTDPNAPAADIYVQSLEGTDEAKFKALQRLANINPAHGESLTLVAEWALKIGNLDLARSQLEKALEESSGVRQSRLMAELEEKAGNAEASREWLVKASEANLDPAWTCGTCGASTDQWEPTCPSCHSFGSLDWRRPLRFVHLPEVEAKPDAAE